MLRERVTKFVNPPKNIIHTVDEVIPPTSADEFITCYGNEASNLYNPASLTKLIAYGFRVSITRRMENIPNEQAGEKVLSTTDLVLNARKMGMFARADEIVSILLLLDGWELANRINARTCDGTGGGFIVPFGFTSVDPVPVKIDASHFNVENPNIGITYAGLQLELEFGGAEYIKGSPPPA